MNTKKDFIENLIVSMSLEEKVGQMTQYGSFHPKTEKLVKEGRVGSLLNSIGSERNNEIQRLAITNSKHHIPLIFGDDVIHGFKTIFPIPLAEASSFNLKLMNKSAKLAALEAYYGGINWIFAPNIDLGFDARFGRVAEGSGEDPYYNCEVAKARIKGFQSSRKIAACAKHFGAYGGVESGRDYMNSKISYHTFLTSHFPPFLAAIKSGVKTMMTSFVDLEGVPFSMNKKINEGLLRKKYHFNGILVSDWCSIEHLIAFGVASDKKEAANKAVKATVDMDMHSECYKENLATLVKEDPNLITYIDDSVRRILSVKYDLGLFDNPYFPTKSFNETYGDKILRKHALTMAANSIILLKNDKGILPLNKKSKIALLGPLATNKEAHLGCWSYKGDINSVIPINEGMFKFVSKDKVLFTKEYSVHSINETILKESVELAKQSDIIVLAIGESRDMSGENNCLTNPSITESQIVLLKELRKLGKPIVSVILAGRPLVIKEVTENSDAILYAWHLGVEAGNAIAQVLYGKHNPSAKLPMSLPYSVGQIPIYYNMNRSCRPELTRYLDAPNTPLYPFGFGLSYSEFEYSNLVVKNKNITKKDYLELSVDVTNKSQVDGIEIVQVYFEDMVSSVITPLKRLCAFKNVRIKKNQTQTVNFKIKTSNFSLVNDKYNRVVEKGKFKIMVGGNSELLLVDEFEII
jgi:beta-glucosidase